MLYVTVQMSSSEGSLALSQIKLLAPLLSSQSTLCKVDIVLLLCPCLVGDETEAEGVQCIALSHSGLRTDQAFLTSHHPALALQ